MKSVLFEINLSGNVMYILNEDEALDISRTFRKVFLQHINIPYFRYRNCLSCNLVLKKCRPITLVGRNPHQTVTFAV